MGAAFSWDKPSMSGRGTIASRETCARCGLRGKWKIIRGRHRDNLCCIQCGEAARRPEIVLSWQGKTLRISHNQTGERFSSYDDAFLALGTIREQVEKQAFYPEHWSSAAQNKMLWENYLAEYLRNEALRLLPGQEATYAKKRSLSKHLAWFNGNSIKTINTGQIKRFASLPCLRLALAPKTRADLLGELRHIFREAKENGEIASVPLVPPVSLPEPGVPDWLTPEQQMKIIDKIPERHRSIFLFWFTYGPRVNEGCALCHDQVNLETGTFTLSRTFSRRKLKDRPKTKRPNVLPIVDWFAEYLDKHKGFGLDPVFKNPDACHHRNPQGFYMDDFCRKLWREAVEAAGYPPIDLKNGTRHSRGMQAYNLQGADLEAVRRILGHTSVAHTRKYAQAETGTIKGILDRGGVVKSLSRANHHTNDSRGKA